MSDYTVKDAIIKQRKPVSLNLLTPTVAI